ncbi:rhomboid family intramembrane serine protease [Rhizobium sp. SG2393]|uniref:rhomboid family intramembrane serine protease n=1 Tax=Rhizobium sp. SG2393 TaxID=3276279 RepID=UPI003672DA35
MFIPLHDANDLKHIDRQYVTIALIVINVLIWLVTGPMASEQTAEAAILGFGYIPAVAFQYADLDPAFVVVPEQATYLTYAFLHGDFWHLAGNMLFLWVFGDNVEDAMGHLRFLAFYLACAAAGALAHGLVNMGSEAPLIGASGAISGVVAAYLMLHPKVRVWVLVLMRIPLPLPAVIPLLLWVGQQFLMLAIDREGTTSWGAHVGGIVAGLVLVVFLRRTGVPLFDRTIVTPRAVRPRSVPAIQATRLDAGGEGPGPWGKGQ